MVYFDKGTGGCIVTLHDYKTVLYCQEDGTWVAEVPAIPGCYALMPTRAEALAELTNVFDMIAEEYREKGIPLPPDTTEIVHA
jgi:predicted RNase H-like HicB family nuclease